MTATENALKYATQVVSGEILACKWIKLACQRHLDDLKKSVDDKGFPYHFSEQKAQHICDFIQRLPHVKGRWAAKKQLIELQPWQYFFLAVLFGWVETGTGLRRFRQAYINVPRKNGKSPIAAGIGLYMLSADGEFGAEVYTGATTQAQAMEVFRPAKQMSERSPEMLEALGLSVHAESLTVESNGSRFQPVIGRPGDGASPSCAIVDEFHEALTPDQFDTFVTGMVGREQPLLLVITTSGTNTASPCHDYQLQAQKVLEGSFDDPTLFALIYTIDADIPWDSEEAIMMANPNIGVSVVLKTLLKEQKTAVQNAAKQNIFKTKHLNVWCNASVSWMNMEKWNTLADPTLSEDQFAGQECYIGLDLATKKDLAASVKLFRRTEEDGKLHYYLFPRFYIPEDQAELPECQHYQKWVHENHLIATSGNVIDFSTILDDLISDTKKFKVRELDFDQWCAEYIRQEFAEKTAITTFDVPQTPQYLSDPALEFEALVLSGRLHHAGNPVMTWCVSNVVAKFNKHDNLELGKDRTTSKIDGVDAALNALYRMLATPLIPVKRNSMKIILL